jgi:hypothetical protein
MQWPNKQIIVLIKQNTNLLGSAIFVGIGNCKPLLYKIGTESFK